MKKIYILSGLMCLLPGLSFGENPRIAELTRSKQEKMERLQKCEGTTKALKIAGLSTIGLTAVGVVGNVVESQKIKEYQGQSNALDTQIAQTKKEIEDKKAAAAAGSTEPTNPTKTPTTSTTSTTTGLATVDTKINGTSHLSWDFNGDCGDEGDNKTSSATSCGDLSAKGHWKVVFEYGTVWGVASCNKDGATDPWDDEEYTYTLQTDGKKTANAMSAIASDGADGKHCWCRVTDFQPKDMSKSPLSASPWIYLRNWKAHTTCERYCVNSCRDVVTYNAAFRTAIFGVE